MDNMYIYQSTKEKIQGFDAQYFLHRENKMDKNRIIQIHMGITNKAISTKFQQIMDRQKLSYSMEVYGVQ